MSGADIFVENLRLTLIRITIAMNFLLNTSIVAPLPAGTALLLPSSDSVLHHY